MNVIKHGHNFLPEDLLVDFAGVQLLPALLAICADEFVSHCVRRDDVNQSDGIVLPLPVDAGCGAPCKHGWRLCTGEFPSI